MGHPITHLSAQVDEVCVRVVHGEHDSVRRVQLNHHDRVVKVARRAQGVLSLAVLGEPRREDEAVLKVDGPRCLKNGNLGELQML